MGRPTDAAEILRTPTRATLLPAPEESINFDTTKNLYIEGDNLEVLKLLYKPYAGRVKLIYIDPPYNTGKDFVYPDDFRDTLSNYLKQTKQTDDAGKLLRSNPETSGRYHSDWLSMMYPRLFMARQLLRDDGVIFVSIDDHEVYHLRMLMNEVFGEENFRAQMRFNHSCGALSEVAHAATASTTCHGSTRSSRTRRIDRRLLAAVGSYIMGQNRSRELPLWRGRLGGRVVG